VQTRARSIVSENTLGLFVHRPYHRSRDTVPGQGPDRSDVCTRVRDCDPRDTRSRSPPTLSMRRVFAQSKSGLAGESELSHLRNPLRAGSHWVREQVHRDGFEGHLVFDRSMGHSSPWSGTGGHPIKTKKCWVVGSERRDFQRHRCEFPPTTRDKRSRCRESIWVGLQHVTRTRFSPKTTTTTGNIVSTSSPSLETWPVDTHLGFTLCGAGIQSSPFAIQCRYVETYLSLQTPAIVPLL